MKRLRKCIKKILFEIKMGFLDFKWHMSHSSYDAYPPSFYYSHTPEEQKRIMERDYQEIRDILEEIDN